MMIDKSKLLILLLAFAFVCVSGDARPQKVTVSGSSTVMPLAELSAEEFNMIQNDYHVMVTSGGSGVGVVDVAQGRSDIAMTSRELHLVERQRYETPSKRFNVVTVGFDAICLMVSPEVYDSGITDLTGEEVKRIYGGSISNWKELGGPDDEIFVIGRKPGSGTRDSFDETIMGSRESETPGVIIEAADSSEVKTAIRGSDNAIGYVGYSYIMRGDTRVISLDGVPPSIDNIRNETYPLARELYFITLGRPGPGAKAFIDYVLSPEGQRIAIENGFIPA
jgi:phosphate transport system substrate-binding protein